jgi:hypothetical protein
MLSDIQYTGESHFTIHGQEINTILLFCLGGGYVNSKA